MDHQIMGFILNIQNHLSHYFLIIKDLYKYPIHVNISFNFDFIRLSIYYPLLYHYLSIITLVSISYFTFNNI